jgi:type 1 glutamine amidotransferase
MNLLVAALSLGLPPAAAVDPGRTPHVVFVTGDEEYRSEESMPMLAKILHRDHKFRVTVCYAVDAEGDIDPNRLDHIEGLEALADADLLVMFTRFRKLPDAELKLITDYVESGKPVMGFRTATHAFRYGAGPHAALMDEAWPRKVFGQKWITHHGHFDDGKAPLTEVTPYPAEITHPILRGVQPFRAYSWLYHVQGGVDEEGKNIDSIEGDPELLLLGRAIKSGHEKEFNRYPRENPVAWTKTYTGGSGKPARVFFTTLGHPYDFKDESMRKLALNGALWALGLEDRIPAKGTDAETVGPYEPTNSGAGSTFKADRKPERIGED